MTTKQELYQQLINDVRLSYPQYSPENNSKDLFWCNDCAEINLWTYWQGRGNLNAKIMLVGQDWGCPWDKLEIKILDNIKQMNEDKNVQYTNNALFITDKNLISLFESIDYNILEHNDKNKDLFFTNLVLGYRGKGCSGEYKTSWAKKDGPYFSRLVSIINPNVILCLGSSTFKGVIQALNVKPATPIKNYNEFLISSDNPIKINSDGKTTHIFALAHCGAMGTLNRNKINQVCDGSLDNQIKDWSKIKKYL